jgi:hypothetical protein
MSRVHRGTIDMNVIRAYLDPRRAGHADASRLIAAAARGDVELAVPPQGSLADLHGQYGADLARDIATLLSKPGVVELPPVARLSDVTFLADNLVPATSWRDSPRRGARSRPSGRHTKARFPALPIAGTSNRTCLLAATSL